MRIDLVPLGRALAQQYTAMVLRNEAFLDLEAAERGMDPAAHIKAFEDPDNLNIKFAVMLNGELVGRVDLNPVDPPKYAIGYWIDEPHNGRGVGSAAVGLAIEHARSTLSATDLYAGVVSDNRASITVLERNGFTRVAELDTHIRYHLPLDGGQPRNP